MIHIEGLTKCFGQRVILDNLNLHVEKGQTLAIIGPSGSGKSTLLRCINMLEVPDSGKVLINGEDVTDPKINLDRIRSNVGMVFQSFNLFPHMTVLENITYAPQVVDKKTKRQAEEKALIILEKVGLKDKANAYPTEISGGQKQRVAIARCLAMDPYVILFDEPTSALDPEMVKEVLEVIKQVEGKDITKLIVTHEMSFAKEVSDRIVFMDHGHILEDQDPKSFFKSPQSERAKIFLKNLS
ncbi:MAG: amino acid ABC transporter ATP-binding protein [Candidatus Paracaedibacteraceae bacterium]|nr:amino acid ABC transporter ATP-binding protein [Candidatus Paracaedibacteraceae bacterium]